MANRKRVVIEVGKRGRRGAPGDMTPAEWQAWQDQLLAAETALETKADATFVGGGKVRYPGDILYIQPDGTAIWRNISDALALNPTLTDRFGYGAFGDGPFPE